MVWFPPWLLPEADWTNNFSFLSRNGFFPALPVAIHLQKWLAVYHEGQLFIDFYFNMTLINAISTNSQTCLLLESGWLLTLRSIFLIAHTGASGHCLLTAPVFLKMSASICSLETSILTLSGLFLAEVKEAPLAVCDDPPQTITSFLSPNMF